jgi:hypothetical protein
VDFGGALWWSRVTGVTTAGRLSLSSVVTWRRALVASLLGNAFPVFIGVIGNGAPWIVHETGGLQ